MTTIIKIYADWCMYCNLMSPEWDKMKDLLEKKNMNNKPDILEIESQNIGMLDVFNKNHKGTDVKLNKYPTIAKYENGKVQYYNDERTANNMLNWILKKPSKYTMKKHKKHNKKHNKKHKTKRKNSTSKN